MLSLKWTNVKESGFRNLGNFGLSNPECGKILVVEFGILGFGIQNTAQSFKILQHFENSEEGFHPPLGAPPPPPPFEPRWRG